MNEKNQWKSNFIEGLQKLETRDDRATMAELRRGHAHYCVDLCPCFLRGSSLCHAGLDDPLSFQLNLVFQLYIESGELRMSLILEATAEAADFSRTI